MAAPMVLHPQCLLSSMSRSRHHVVAKRKNASVLTKTTDPKQMRLFEKRLKKKPVLCHVSKRTEY